MVEIRPPKLDLLTSIIKDHIRELERRGQAVFVRLAHPPDHAQADFGEVMVRISF
ncbi:MAG: hypothetical protein Q4G49_00480 [Paracoccus sp. (in: a-proteobacteria)]|nr:hypothetical protein [Paracoccus sp. (in: a-proteobacteria)]